ncbi:ZO-2 associated speckle protein [Cebus imitator]|uniref:ZO-2 associated speckle protein n=1 Tax=Cebus imitator TaxID=2715852 RepID=UPI00080A3713|nr:ZO-2 associated speckle protein [Cebus imitator]
MSMSGLRVREHICALCANTSALHGGGSGHGHGSVHLPLEMPASCSRSLSPYVILLSVTADSFLGSHLSPSPDCTVSPRMPGPAPDPLPWVGSRRGHCGEANLAPSPRSPCASPTTSWRRRGPREGASPTSLLSSTPCWTGLRGEGGVTGPTPPRTREVEDAPGLHALRQELSEGSLGPLGLQAWPSPGVEGPRVSQVSCQLQ